jgi:polyphosphate kinase
MNETQFLPTPSSFLVHPGEPFIHRDMSWLQFNERVLQEARTGSNPLLERLKFLAITSRNLDEFFMIRYLSVSELKSHSNRKNKTRIQESVRKTLLEKVSTFSAIQSETLDLLSSELETHGVYIVQQAKRDDRFMTMGRKIFFEKIFPFLGPPEIVSPGSLSKIENLQIGVIASGGLAWKLARNIPLVFLEKVDSESFIFFLDDLLLTFMVEAFRLHGPIGVLRFTRDGDLSIESLEEDPHLIPEIVRANLRSRDQGRFVRVESTGEISQFWLKKLVKYGKINPHQIQTSPTTLCLGALWTFVGALTKEKKTELTMCHPDTQAIVPQGMKFDDKDPGAIFGTILKKDILLHHPYDSFDAYVNFVRAACLDPLVVEICQTVYRMDAVSPVIDLLKAAASNRENPKKVRVIIELRARFDELNNLELAENLRASGVDVGFGFGELKLHAKITHVRRKNQNNPSQIQHFTHLSTGNYNSQTARIYEDFALVTANPVFGEDASLFFNSVFKGEVPKGFKVLVGAPIQLHRKLLNLIEAETAAALRGEKARIKAKVNALVDEGVIAKLYEASRAGVRIDLVVRGACSLIPGVKNLSENIRVMSVVDRYLEHSRIYYFGYSKKMYLSSADWMPRNFFSRLELAFPILDENIFKFLENIVLPAYAVDTVRARELTAQGTWKKRTPTTLLTSQKKVAQELSKLVGNKSYEKPDPKYFGVSDKKTKDPQIRVQFFFEDLNSRLLEG